MGRGAAAAVSTDGLVWRGGWVEAAVETFLGDGMVASRVARASDPGNQTHLTAYYVLSKNNCILSG